MMQLNTLIRFTEPLIGSPQISEGYRLTLPYNLNHWLEIVNFLSDELGEGVVRINQERFHLINHPRWATSRSQLIYNANLCVIVDTLEPIERLLNLLNLKIRLTSE